MSLGKVKTNVITARALNRYPQLGSDFCIRARAVLLQKCYTCQSCWTFISKGKRPI